MRLNTDTVPAMLTPGEGVLNQYAMNLPGVKQFVQNRNMMGNQIGASMNERSNFGNQGKKKKILNFRGYAAGTTGVAPMPINDDDPSGTKNYDPNQFPWKTSMNQPTDTTNPLNAIPSGMDRAALSAWAGALGNTAASPSGTGGPSLIGGVPGPTIDPNRQPLPPLINPALIGPVTDPASPSGTGSSLMSGEGDLGGLRIDGQPQFRNWGGLPTAGLPVHGSPIRVPPPVRVPPGSGVPGFMPPPPVQGLARGGVVNGRFKIPRMLMRNGQVIPMSMPAGMPANAG